jgi:hypothetical protein
MALYSLNTTSNILNQTFKNNLNYIKNSKIRYSLTISQLIGSKPKNSGTWVKKQFKSFLKNLNNDK